MMKTSFSLLEQVKLGEVQPTGAKPKLPIKLDGLNSENLDVYRIPLEYLYYNDENGRISASYHSGIEVARTMDDNDAYNLSVEQLIEKSDTSLLRKTKANIKEKGQLIFGYVLDDGRVIDGNRRFTALRQLKREEQMEQFFEAVILPVTFDSKLSRSKIKLLELAIQEGVESKVDYDPVDSAVAAWKTIDVDELVPLGDYASTSGKTKKTIENQIQTVYLMQDFLESINADSDNFQLIKDVKLYNPLFELSKGLKKHFPKSGPDMEVAKEAAFIHLHLLTKTGGDLVRKIRKYIEDIIVTKKYEKFQDDLEESIEIIQDTFDNKEKVRSAAEYSSSLDQVLPEIRTVQKVTNDLQRSSRRAQDVDNFKTSIQEIESSLKEISDGNGLVGTLRWSQFSEQDISDFLDAMTEISRISTELAEVYADEL